MATGTCSPGAPRTIRALPLDAATSTLYGAARRAADFVARASLPPTASAECSEALGALLDGLRQPGSPR